MTDETTDEKTDDFQDTLDRLTKQVSTDGWADLTPLLDMLG